MQVLPKVSPLIAATPTIQDEGIESMTKEKIASGGVAQGIENPKQRNHLLDMVKKMSSITVSAIVRPKSLAKPLPTGIESPISFESYLQMTKRSDTWRTFLEQAATMTVETLALQHSSDFVMDARRHAFILKETLIDAEVSVIDTFMLSELMEAGVSDERLLHILRYLLQDLMHQGLFAIDRQVIDNYQTRYFESDMNLGGFGHNPERLAKAKLIDSIGFRIENKKVTLCANQYWQVVPNGSPTLEPVGFDKLTVELVFDLSKVDKTLWLLTPGCCKASAKFQGFSKDLC